MPGRDVYVVFSRSAGGVMVEILADVRLQYLPIDTFSREEELVLPANDYLSH